MNSKDRVLLDTEMEALPLREDMLVIDRIVYECLSTKHIFTPERGGKVSYAAEIRIRPS